MESEKHMSSVLLNTLQEEYSIVVTEPPYFFCYTQLYGTEDRR